MNTAADESHPSLTEEGTLYFYRGEPENSTSSDLLRANRSAIAGQFETSDRLPEPVNSGFADYDPHAAPDGSYLIFASRRPGGEGQGDLYIAFSLPGGG